MSEMQGVCSSWVYVVKSDLVFCLFFCQKSDSNFISVHMCHETMNELPSLMLLQQKTALSSFFVNHYCLFSCLNIKMGKQTDHLMQICFNPSQAKRRSQSYKEENRRKQELQRDYVGFYCE